MKELAKLIRKLKHPKKLAKLYPHIYKPRNILIDKILDIIKQYEQDK